MNLLSFASRLWTWYELVSSPFIRGSTAVYPASINLTVNSQPMKPFASGLKIHQKFVMSEIFNCIYGPKIQQFSLRNIAYVAMNLCYLIRLSRIKRFQYDVKWFPLTYQYLWTSTSLTLPFAMFLSCRRKQIKILHK